MKKIVSTVVFSLLGALASVSAIAAPMLDVDAQGILIGASNIVVGQSSYSVRFVDTSILATPSLTAPFLNDAVGAYEAAQSLFNLINASPFAITPNAIAGCTGAGLFCQIDTPFSLDPSRPWVNLWASMVTEISTDPNRLSGYGCCAAFDDYWDMGDAGNFVYAAWSTTSVPEPTGITLFALGGAALWLRRRREVRIK